MPRIFLSHSSKDNRQTRAFVQWLFEQDPSLQRDVFVDLDGMEGGEEFRITLRRNFAASESVLCLLSENWDDSRECWHEYLSARDSGKTVYCARLQDGAGNGEISAVQRRDLFPLDGAETTSVDIGEGDPVVFSTEGLRRQLRDLQLPDLGPDSFRWPPLGDEGRAPYRGWLPFDRQDAGVFFGRDAELARAVHALREMRDPDDEALFVVLGASGTGKSAFLRAGILPRLEREAHRFTLLGVVRPGRGEALTGESGLAKAIHTARAGVGLTAPTFGEIKNDYVHDVTEVRRLLVECQQRAAELHGDSGQLPPTLVLPIDQAEELFSAEAGEEAAALLAVMRDLDATADDGSPPLNLIFIATIRTDRYPVMQTAPELAAIRRTSHDLIPMPESRFREVIEGPARRSTQGGRQLRLEPELLDRLLDDARANVRGGDTLPLLSLTLHTMFVDYGEGKTLTAAQYDQMGGMDRVVRSTVNGLLSKSEDTLRDELERLRAAFVPWLATVNPDNDQPLRRIALWADLPESSRDLVEKFVEARLLIRDNRELGAEKGVKCDVVEVALESLLRQWDELAGWLREQGTDLKAADDLLRQAEMWKANGKEPSYLWHGKLLASAETLSAEPTFVRKLESTRDFVVASREQETQRQESALAAERDKQRLLRQAARRLKSVLAVTVVVALVAVAGLIGALFARQAAKHSAQQATAQRLVPEALAMLADTREGSDIRAFQELLVAHRLADGGNSGPLVDALVKRFSTIRIGTTTKGPAIGAAFADTGHRLAVGDTDGHISVWDTTSPTWRERPLDDPRKIDASGKITGIAISPDGKLLVGGAEGGAVLGWNLDDPNLAEQKIAAHKGRVTSVAVSRDGRAVASAGADGTVLLTRPAGGPQITISTGAPVFSVAFDPVGHRIATGGADGTIRLWKTDTGAAAGVIKAHARGVMSVAFSPDGSLIASGGIDSAVRLWDAKSLSESAWLSTASPGTPAHTEAVMTVAFNADGTRLASAGVDLTVQVWDVQRRQRIGDPMVGHEGIVWSVAFVSDGDEIVSAANDHQIRVWNAAVGQPLSQPLTDHRGPVTSVAISNDRIASATADKTVQLWSSDTGRLIKILPTHGGQVTRVAFSPAGDLLASACTDGTIRLWRAADGVAVATLQAGKPVFAVALDAKGSRLASASGDGDLTVWNLASGMPTRLPNLDNAVVLGVAFSPRDDRLLSGGANGVLRLWGLDTNSQVWERNAVEFLPSDQKQDWARNHPIVITSVAFGPDGRLAASAANGWSGPDALAIGIIQRWDASSGNPVGRPIKTNEVGTAVTSVTFSPHRPDLRGDRIVSGSSDRSIRLWNADFDEGEQVGDSFLGHQDMVGSVAVSPDGSRIVSGSADGTVRIWPNPPTIAPDEALCAKLTANMSDAEWNEWIGSDLGYEKVCETMQVPS